MDSVVVAGALLGAGFLAVSLSAHPLAFAAAALSAQRSG